MTKYSRNVGKKFHENGKAREFPGNTVICHIPKESETFKFLLEVQKELKSQPWARKYAFLPPSSFHMTVFEGVCDQVRRKDVWPSVLPLDAPLEEVDHFLIEQWKDIEKPSSFKMKYKHLSIGNTIILALEPIDSEENKKIRGFRDLLSEKFKIKTRNHRFYGFHTSQAYLIEKLSWKEKKQIKKFIEKKNEEYRKRFGVVELKEPELTFFADMTNFAPSRAEAKRNVEE